METAADEPVHDGPGPAQEAGTGAAAQQTPLRLVSGAAEEFSARDCAVFRLVDFVPIIPDRIITFAGLKQSPSCCCAVFVN